MHRERTRGMETKKYLRKNCCRHCIKCPTANFLVAFMWRRPLNSVALATITHRRPERVSDGIDTQMVAQMTNTCRIKIVQNGLYNVRDPSWMGDWGNDRRKLCSNLNYVFNCFQSIYTRTDLIGSSR